jgi:integrase
MFATLLGCGLRRSELAALTMKHVQMRDSRWCIVGLVGKHGRVRTVPMPTWSKNAIDAWTTEAGVTEGHLFRPINRSDQVFGERLSEKVVWQMLKSYVVAAGLPDIAPHDLRRTTASCVGPRAENSSRSRCCSGIRRCRPPSGISGRSRILAHAPNDGIKLKLA